MADAGAEVHRSPAWRTCPARAVPSSPINHTSYFDFTFAGLPAYKQHLGRKVRFMAKKEVSDGKLTGPLMRSLRHIEVDRGRRRRLVRAGLPGAQGRRAGRRLPGGHDQPQLRDQGVQVGAARMAIAADVPIVPHIVWGAQRIWTKGHPKNDVAPQGADLDRGRRADRADPATHRAHRLAAFADAAPAGAGAGRLRPASTRRVLGAAPAGGGERRRWPRPIGWTPRRPPRRPPVARNGPTPPGRRGSAVWSRLSARWRSRPRRQ